tara:strand:+ start:708 stop:983 length:276 start_codon:yes stop_codon:yes gene_type:complete
MKRFHCEFKNCTCPQFVKNKRLCKKCNHSHIWHSKISNYSQFSSSRKPARKPKYVSEVIFGQIHIFKPLPLAPAIEVANPCFCIDVYALPV